MNMHIDICISEEIRQDKVAALAKRLSLAGDPNRLRILCAIFDGERLCVSEIADTLGMSVATASHHLNALADAGLVTAERQGKRVCYSLKKSRFNADLKCFICRNR